MCYFKLHYQKNCSQYTLFTSFQMLKMKTMLKLKWHFVLFCLLSHKHALNIQDCGLLLKKMVEEI